MSTKRQEHFCGTKYVINQHPIHNFK